MNILIVEDNATMRAMIKETVEEWGHVAVECSDGSSALAAYARYLPDAVLMDIEMKGMDGITATRSIRRQFPGAKIIIVTNHDDDVLREEAVKAGASGYVMKENLEDVYTCMIR